MVTETGDQRHHGPEGAGKGSTSTIQEDIEEEWYDACDEEIMKAELTTFGPRQPGALFHILEDERWDNFLGKEQVLGVEFHGRLLTKRFVTLRYVEGLKYTFGNTLRGRGRQEEFVFLDLQDSSPTTAPNEGNYFILECKDEGLWISDHESQEICNSFVTSVNEIPISLGGTYDGKERLEQFPSSVTQRRLFFGDVITLSVGNIRLELLFTPPPLSVSPGNHGLFPVACNEDKNQVLDNYLVIGKILSFLSTSLIKRLRFLSSRWNTETLKVLRNRVVVTPFKFGGITNAADDANQISTYAYSQMNRIRFPFWTVVFRKDWWLQFYDGGRKLQQTEMKILRDLLWFFDPNVFSHNVKSLDVSGDLHSETGFHMLHAILRGVKGTLVTLNVKVTCTSRPLIATPPPVCQFPALRNLSLASYSDRGCIYRHALCQPEYPSCVRLAIQGLLTGVGLRLGNVMLFSEAHEVLPPRSKFSVMVVGEMLGVQGRLPGSWGNLTRITLQCWDNLELLQPLATLEAHGLKTLDLLYLPAGTIHIRPILEKHGENLEELFLHFDNCLRNDDEEIKVSLPRRMSKLRSLQVFLAPFYDAPRGFSFTVPQLGNLNAENEINFDCRKQFPALSQLTVWPVDCCSDNHSTNFTRNSENGSWRNFLPFITAFLPTAGDDEGNGHHIVPVSSVRSLDIPFLLMGQYHRVLDNLEVSFPNVVFSPELSQVRQSPVWTVEDEESSEEVEDLIPA